MSTRASSIHAWTFASRGGVLSVLVLCAGFSCNTGTAPRDTAFDDDGLPIEGPPPPPPPSLSELKVRINELMVENTSTLQDSAGRFSPWVELYNPTDAAVNLRGVFLSDDLLFAGKWTIPNVAGAVISPGGFLIIFLDGESSTEEEIHAGFRLRAGPLQIILNKGSDIFYFDRSKLGPDVSAGLFPDGASSVAVLREPTPGASNTEPPPTDLGGTFVRGDANDDGRVNVTDMIALLKVLFDASPLPSCVDRLDANDDGRVDLTDVLFIGQALHGRGPPFPPPYPLAGTDPTPDALPCPDG
ncbi:MAG TPA: lamin tail domain-containing protein [Planctomycetota bacterium]|nr:lamin tail domain-containing protein [Planctomycetota bacterium]